MKKDDRYKKINIIDIINKKAQTKTTKESLEDIIPFDFDDKTNIVMDIVNK